MAVRRKTAGASFHYLRMHGASNLSVRLLELGEVDAYLDLTVVVDAGSMLVDAAIEWAKHEPGIAWIDLEVFSDNPAAQALYMRHGFLVLGRTPDRFRVDGHSLEDISITIDVL